MLLAKKNLEGVEVIVKYAAYPKDLLEIVYGETDYYFYIVLIYSLNYCFYINLRYVRNVTVLCQIIYLCYVEKMRPTVFHTFLNLVRVWENFPTELHAPLRINLFRFWEVIVKYAAYPKDLLEIVYGETDYYFYIVLIYSLNYCFYINLRYVRNVTVLCQIIYLCYVEKMRPTVFHTFLNLVRVWENFPTELHAPLHINLFRFYP